MERPFSSYNALTYTLAVHARQAERGIRWLTDGKRYARTFFPDPLPFRVYKHQSVLLRRLGDTDMKLQRNKVTNIQLAIARLDGVIIRPGETFSFCRLVGRPTRRKGYLDGVLLKNGEAVAGTGGGICQIANLIHWLCLHSPLTVTEHHHHSFDPFPDSGRVVPFGSGATVSYNYIDYQVENRTDRTFQLRFWLDQKCLNGDLRIDRELPYKYHIVERDHEFLKVGGEFYRTNSLWRKKVKKLGSGDILEMTCYQRNFSLVKYTPETYRVLDKLPPEYGQAAGE